MTTSKRTFTPKIPVTRTRITTAVAAADASLSQHTRVRRGRGRGGSSTTTRPPISLESTPVSGPFAQGPAQEGYRSHSSSHSFVASRIARTSTKTESLGAASNGTDSEEEEEEDEVHVVRDDGKDGKSTVLPFLMPEKLMRTVSHTSNASNAKVNSKTGQSALSQSFVPDNEDEEETNVMQEPGLSLFGTESLSLREDELHLWQLPHWLPHLDMAESESKSQSQPSKELPSHSGRIGTLLIHESGRMQLVLGRKDQGQPFVLDVQSGSQAEDMIQHLCAIDLKKEEETPVKMEQEEKSQLIHLGRVSANRMVCMPRLDSLMDKVYIR